MSESKANKSLSGYFDCMSTYPTLDCVKTHLRALLGKDNLIANSSSSHYFGREAKSLIEETTEVILKYFNISREDYSIIYCSSATEAAQTLKENFSYLKTKGISVSAHSCFMELINKDISASLINIDVNGRFQSEKKNDVAYINPISHETGNIFSGINDVNSDKVVVDGSQLVGKIPRVEMLSNHFQYSDCFFFSGHKIGALTGVAPLLIKKSVKFKPLLLGGGQQTQLRAGTVNTLAIISLKTALEYWHNSEAKILNHNSELKNYFCEKILSIENINLVNLFNCDQISNFTNIEVDESINGDVFLIKLDEYRIAISRGSACLSSSYKITPLLKSIGLNPKRAKNIFRVSFGIFHSKADVDHLVDVLKKCVTN